MKRAAAGLIGLVCVTSFGCKTASSRTLACLAVNSASFTNTVDGKADVGQACIQIQPGNTDVKWEGGADVKRLFVTFKRNQKTHPNDPVCSGASCFLEKMESKTEGDFGYTVIVVREDGSVEWVDPRLIIKPLVL